MMSLRSTAPRCIAVTGREGTGKTWLAACTWLALPDRPVALFATHKHVHLLFPGSPMEVLARLASEQSAGEAGRDFEMWRRRFERWSESSRPTTQANFVVVLDGLNEAMGKRWATLIQHLAELLARLGGLVVVTSREAFWKENVLPRLEHSGLQISELPVPGYTDAEVRLLVRDAGHDPYTVSGELLSFLANPRVCYLALSLLDTLDGTPADLTVDRVLVEYWRSRVQERGDAVAHNPREFENVLRSHARTLRERGSATFDRNDWREHWALTRRQDGRDAGTDLADIEDGAFMTISEGDPDRYEFKPDVVPFALGLLLADEVSRAVSSGSVSLSEVLESISEEMGGFDQVAEALRAAAGIAFFSPGYTDAARSALAVAWLRAQNRPLSHEGDLAPFLRAAPGAVLDAYEVLFRDGSEAGTTVMNAILLARNDARVAPVVRSRVQRWLRFWSRTCPWLAPGHPDREGFIQRWEKRLSKAMAGLSEDEHAFLQRECIETDDASGPDLAGAAALLLASGTQEWAAASLLAWNFSSSMTGELSRAGSEMHWAIRLNGSDFPATHQAISAAALAYQGRLLTDAGNRAGFSLLRSLGTLEADQASAGFWIPPASDGESWRLVEDYCETDPYDPASSRGDIARAQSAVASLDVRRVWSFMGRSDDDHELEYSLPGLARFDHGPLIGALRAAAASAARRDGLSLTHLVGPLRSLSPLFDGVTAVDVETALRRVLDGNAVVESELRPLVAASLHSSLLPHIGARKQLELLLALPAEVSDTVELQPGFKALDMDEAWDALADARSDGTPPFVSRTLHFLTASAGNLDSRCRDAIRFFLSDASARIVAGAATLAAATRDPSLAIAVLDASAKGWPEGSETIEDLLDAATARAVTLAADQSSLHLVKPRHLGQTVLAFGEAAVILLEDTTAEAIDRLLRPIATARMEAVNLNVHIGTPDKPRNLSFTYHDEGDLETEAGRVVRRRPGSAVNRRLRAKARVGELRAYLNSLRGEGALQVVEEPDLRGLERLASDRPRSCADWAGRIIAEPDDDRAAAIRNLGLALALAIARSEPELAVGIIDRVYGLRGHVSITLSPDGLPLAAAALFASSGASCFMDARSRLLDAATNDAALQDLAVAADLYGHGEWLTSWVAGRLASRFPGDTARGITVAGLRLRRTASDVALDRDWGEGFLAEVAGHAIKARDRHRWAEHWLSASLSADSPEDFWRFGHLARGISDIRITVELPPVSRDTRFDTYLPYLTPLLGHEAALRKSKRRKTLFGLPPPTWLQ